MWGSEMGSQQPFNRGGKQPAALTYDTKPAAVTPRTTKTAEVKGRRGVRRGRRGTSDSTPPRCGERSEPHKRTVDPKRLRTT